MAVLPTSQAWLDQSALLITACPNVRLEEEEEAEAEYRLPREHSICDAERQTHSDVYYMLYQRQQHTNHTVHSPAFFSNRPESHRNTPSSPPKKPRSPSSKRARPRSRPGVGPTRHRCRRPTPSPSRDTGAASPSRRTIRRRACASSTRPTRRPRWAG